MQIEDQTLPKRCGHMEGKQVIPRDEMVKKVRAALAARADDGTVIIARTDAIAVTGLEDALARMQAYAEAGADVIFPDAPRSISTSCARSPRSDQPLVANMSEHGKTPLLSREEIGSSATRSRSTLVDAVRSSAVAREVAELLIRDGTTRRTGSTGSSSSTSSTSSSASPRGRRRRRGLPGERDRLRDRVDADRLRSRRLDRDGLPSARLGVRQVMLVSDPHVHDLGITDRVRAAIAEPRHRDRGVCRGGGAERGIGSRGDRRASRRRLRRLRGVGGGSSIDTAKIAALVITHGGELLDWVNRPIREGKPVPGPLLPVVAVPTTAGTGSEATSVAILDFPRLGVKTGSRTATCARGSASSTRC